MRNPMSAAQDELSFPGAITEGSRGAGTKRLQEWLTFRGFGLSIDGAFGPSTAHQLDAFQASVGAKRTATLSQSTWNELVSPLARALDPVTVAARDSLSAVVIKTALQHFDSRPVEVGGQNRGPWVRAYMDGNDGTDYPWCAGFVTFIVAAACEQLGTEMPILRTYSCDSLAIDARNKGRLISPRAVDWKSLGSAQIFLVQRSTNDWSHTGLSFDGSDQIFSTVEGNSNDNGSSEGYEVCKRQRTLAGKSLIRLD
jgi:Putative peptidoglycan binding domain